MISGEPPSGIPVGLHHVQLAMPRGGKEAAEAFYGGLLGLGRVPKPSNLAGRGGCWFRAEDADDPFGNRIELLEPWAG